MEIAPALWPQLYGANEVSDLGDDMRGSAEKNSRGDSVWITAELGNVSLDPVQEEPFCQIPEVLVLQVAARVGNREMD